MSCTLSETQLGTGTFPKEEVEANAALSSFFSPLLIALPISLRMIRRSREKAEISMGVLVSWEESKLWSDVGGDAGTGADGLTWLLPKREAKGRLIREDVVEIVEAAGRLEGLGGSGGFDEVGVRGGR